MRPDSSLSRASLVLALASLSLTVLAPRAAEAKKLKPAKAASGLKEALSLGSGRAVEILGAFDGYLGNADVRIQPPKGLKTVEKGLRLLGQDQLVDEFVTSMNRAAEAAAPLAKEVFLDAIKEMSFDDAVRIVRGDDHAATTYLDEHSRDHLSELFRPIVAEKLQEVGATAAFDDLVEQYLTMPFASKPAIDLEGHVTDKALDGMFFMIAKEEENIRNNVIARTSDVLKDVFGKQSRSGGSKKWWEKL